MISDQIPGGFSEEDSKFELDYWENFGGVENFDLHFHTYKQCFPLANLDFEKENILDIGSGAISIFEKVAPVGSNIIPFDVLAEEYNRIAPDKKFRVVRSLAETQKFSLISLFNMIDHVVEPSEILSFAAEHLEADGRLWLAVHIYQPHGEKGHPQNFNCRSIVDLVSQYFRIDKCGVIREAVPHPYLWWGQLSKNAESPVRLYYLWLKLKTGISVARLQAVRAVVKMVKIFGLRNFLPMTWRF